MEEGDLVLCTVDRIDGTTVFVTLENGIKGTIITSEIAPGRIKNIREYVVPKKKIACKILRVRGDNIDLSLRRVSSKERKEIMERYKQRQQAKSSIYQILKGEAEETERKIMNDFNSLLEFLDKASENPEILEKYIPKVFLEQIKKITQKKKKEIQAVKILKLRCPEEDGILRIKKILSIKDEKVRVIYLSAGNFQIIIKAEDYKQANKQMEDLIREIEDSSKKNLCEFEVLEKK